MNLTEGKYGWLISPQVCFGCDCYTMILTKMILATFKAYVSLKHEGDKVLVFERAGLLFIFNFHPSSSYTDYRVGVEEPGEYHAVLTSDEKRFGGFGNIDLNSKYFTTPMEWNNRKNWLQVSCPI